MPYLGQPGQIGTIAKSAPGRDTVLDRLDALEKFIRGLTVAQSINYTTVDPDAPIIEQILGAAGTVLLKLSTTDAAFNDAAIDAAIASFNGGMGTIYAPQNPFTTSGESQSGQSYPIATAHDFQNTDLVGAGNYNNVVDSGTTFEFTTGEAQFKFSGAGTLTGGFVIYVSYLGGLAHPFVRDWSYGSTTPIQGREFRNIGFAGSNGFGFPNATVNDGYVIVWDADDTTFTVTNSDGTFDTGPLTCSTLTAAALQTALEGLTNVGTGNVTVTDYAPLDTGSGVQGGPFQFSFATASDSTISATSTHSGGGYVATDIVPLETRDGAFIYIANALQDRYENFNFNSASGHGIVLENCNQIVFERCYWQFASGHLIYLTSSEVYFNGCNLNGPQGLFLAGGAASPSYQMDFTDCELFSQGTGRCALVGGPSMRRVNFTSGGIFGDTSFGQTGTAVTAFYVAGDCGLNGVVGLDGRFILAALDDTGTLLDHKAFIDGFDPSTGIIYLASATSEQASAQFQVGLTSGGTVQLLAAATGARPAGTLPAGGAIFDTTLGKPIWSDGTGGWVDATGTAV